MTGKIDIPLLLNIKQLDERDINHSEHIFFFKDEDLISQGGENR